MYLKTPYKIFYNIEEFSFKEIIKNIFSTDSLEGLHLLKNYDLLEREKDQSTIWHKKYYENFENEFKDSYLKLIAYIKKCLDYDELIYQKIPTFRAQLGNGNVAVGEWHKDKSYNHGSTEVNFWMPFTNTNKHNSIWIESEEDKGDYRPYEVNYGEILVFDGANLKHGNQKNQSNETRVSIDFRLVDPKKFTPNSAGSINTNTKFDIGGYFEKI